MVVYRLQTNENPYIDAYDLPCFAHHSPIYTLCPISPESQPFYTLLPLPENAPPNSVLS